MKKLIKSLFSLALIGFIIPSCSNPAKMAEEAARVSLKANPEVLEVVAGKIATSVSATFPDGYFHPKAILEVVPVLVYQGGEVASKTVMLQGEDITENYKVIPKTGATVSYDLNFDYKPGMEKSHLELRMTVVNKDKRIAFPAPYKVAEGANTTYMLVKNEGALAYAPDAYQSVIPEKGEAQILYLINSSTVRPTELKKDQIKAFQDFLANVQKDERRTVTGTDIVAYASPDGKEALNEKLSSKRAETAGDAYNKTINKKAAVAAPVKSTSVSEDWEGFKELVAASNVKDKDLILRVLEMYSDPIVREREIRNMSQVFTILAKDVLPQLRRARFIANIEFKNYTGEELLAMVNSNIEILDEEALLHAASLVKENDTKVTVYTKAIEKFSSDRAKVNLAVTYLKMDKNADAEKALSSVSNKDCYYYNTAGVIALRKGDNAAATANFAKSSLKESKYSTAVVDILNGKYADAYNKLQGSGSHNEALAAILVNKLDNAYSVVEKAKCPCKNYLKAIIAARQGKVSDAKAALEVAVKEEALAKRALTDIEFAKVK